jgi:hypothetical protein
MSWILILLLVLDDGCMSCDSLIWILLLSRFCGGDDCGCGCPTNTCSNCGCAR